MKPCTGSRAGLALLLLGFTLQSVVPIALGSDHDHGHLATAYETSAERVSLHGHDGDHDHEDARLELGEKSSHPFCALCAQIGKSSALPVHSLAFAATLDARPSLLPEAAFVDARFGNEPCQPRAPPRVLNPRNA